MDIVSFICWFAAGFCIGWVYAFIERKIKNRKKRKDEDKLDYIKMYIEETLNDFQSDLDDIKKQIKLATRGLKR